LGCPPATRRGVVLPRTECRARHEVSDPAMAGESKDDGSGAPGLSGGLHRNETLGSTSDPIPPLRWTVPPKTIETRLFSRYNKRLGSNFGGYGFGRIAQPPPQDLADPPCLATMIGECAKNCGASVAGVRALPSPHTQRCDCLGDATQNAAPALDPLLSLAEPLGVGYRPTWHVVQGRSHEGGVPPAHGAVRSGLRDVAPHGWCYRVVRVQRGAPHARGHPDGWQSGSGAVSSAG